MAEWQWPNSVITAVVDCDTVDALVTRDLGFGGTATFPIRLRLNRIDGYRVSTQLGRRGKARVASATAGVRMHITTVKTYKYGGPDAMLGEYMAEVVLPDGRNLSDLLVAEGLAVYWDGTGPRPAQL